jgi:branched-chain amino acid transport system substrate-binding protein
MNKSGGWNMKNNKKMILLVSLVLAFALVVTGCASKPAQEEAAGEIKIAVVGPMTGDSAQYGQAFQKATELMAKKVNEAGGVDGKMIKLEIVDDKNDAKEATNVAQKLVSDQDVVGVIGHFSSTASLAAAPIYQRAGLVELSPTSSHPDFTSQGTFMFRNVNTQAIEGPILADFAVKDLEKKNIAVIYINNDWGITAKDNFIAGAEALGANITAVESFIGGQTKDFTPTITKIKGTNPDLLFLAAMYSETGMIAQQIKQLDYDIELLGTSSLNNQQLIELAGPAVEGLYLTNNYFAEDPSENVQGFVKEFREAYGTEPDQFAAVAYDSLGMMIEALKVSGPDRVKLRDALAEVKDYPGVTGKTTFNENRDVLKDMIIMQIKDSKFTLFKK